MIRKRKYDAFWENLAKAMANSGNPSLVELMSQVTPQFKSLIQGMLDADPNRRLTIAQVKAHPWFEGTHATL